MWNRRNETLQDVHFFNSTLYHLPLKQITKEKYNHKPTYETLKQSLEAMKAHCVENGVTRLSVPRYGVFCMDSTYH